jgi:tetratricopeptide (TPR) repeat protein
LKERTRERVPLDWAVTQINLGNALQTLGERESGTIRLERAVAAYRAALKESTRENAPLDWATTKLNLGNALRTLSERGSGTVQLAQAIEAYRDALKEFTPQQAPENNKIVLDALSDTQKAFVARKRGPVK